LTKTGYDHFIGSAMLGLLLSPPLLFAFWAAFAPQRFSIRFLWSFFGSILVAFAAELQCSLHTSLDLALLIIELIFFTTATLILLVVRRLSRWQIIHSSTEYATSDYRASQFGIKHLIILTTLVGLAFGLFRTLAEFKARYPYGLPFLDMVRRICDFFLTILPLIVIPWFILAHLKNRLLSIVCLIILLGIFDVAAHCIILNPEQILGIIPFMLYIQLGTGISVILTVFILRLCGFRMVREIKVTI
jgi:hypothetical protein